MRLDALSLKTRLIVAVAIPCIALLLVALTSLNSMSSMHRDTEVLYLNTAAPMRAMAEVASRIPRMRVTMRSMKGERSVGLSPWPCGPAIAGLVDLVRLSILLSNFLHGSIIKYPSPLWAWAWGRRRAGVARGLAPAQR